MSTPHNDRVLVAYVIQQIEKNTSNISYELIEQELTSLGLEADTETINEMIDFHRAWGAAQNF